MDQDHAITCFLDLPGVSLESKRKILWDNCIRLYGFDGAALLQQAAATA